MLDEDECNEDSSDQNAEIPQNTKSSPKQNNFTSKNETCEDLGLVLSDNEDDFKKSSKSLLSSAFSSSKYESTSEEVNIDPLEKELQDMEARMKLLKDQLAKKKRFSQDECYSKKFTKLTNVVNDASCKTRSLDYNEKKMLMKKLNEKSEIHSGDTDSEDDEDNRNPFESRYSSLGKELKRIAHSKENSSSSSKNHIIHQPKTREIQDKLKMKGDPTASSPSCKSWKELKGSLVSIKSGGIEDTDKNVSIDQYSGIRIINPLISSNTMKDLMESRKMVRISTINLHLQNGTIEGDWVTIGVLVNKGNPKTSQKGSQYSIWQLSDLKDCTKTVALFLFGGAHKNLWKTSVGTVVGILNSQIMKDKQNDKSTDILTLSINNHQKLLVMGASKDLGWCKGKTKQNIQCRQFVNKSSCEFCIYHIQKEYKKTCAKRQDVQSSFSRVEPKKMSLQQKVFGKNEVKIINYI